MLVSAVCKTNNSYLPEDSGMNLLLLHSGCSGSFLMLLPAAEFYFVPPSEIKPAAFFYPDKKNPRRTMRGDHSGKL